MDKNLEFQNSAINLLHLYSQHDGVPGNPIENWYIRNRSVSKAIKFTILFWRGNIAFGDKWTRTYSVEPGEIINIGNKRRMLSVTIHAKINGARFFP